MNKKGIKWQAASLWLVAMLVGAVACVQLYDRFGGDKAASIGGLSANELEQLAAEASFSCPTTGATGVVLNVANYLNVSGETFDVTAYVRNLETGAITTISDTTNPSATNFNCGQKHRLEIVAANADAGDNSRVEKILVGGATASAAADGTVDFIPTGATYGLTVGVTQHAILEFRGYDNLNKGLMCNSDDTCSDYELDTVSFESTTNGTAMAIGDGGALDVTIEARATRSDTDFNDMYTLILLEAPIATWDVPTVKVDGVKLDNIKNTGLTPEELLQFNGYEYIYKIDKPILDAGDGIDVDVYMKAKDGQNPSVDPELDFAAAGRYLSANTVDTKAGAADDTTSNTVVYTVQDVTLNIS